MPFVSSLSPSSNLSRAAFRFSAVAFILGVMAVAPKAAAECTAAAGVVQICLPAANATVASPVHVVGASNLSPAATSTLVYVDNVLQYTSNGPAVDTNVTMAAGTHVLLLQSYNGAATDGGWVKTSENITVSGGSTGCTAPAGTTIICSPPPNTTVGSPVHVVGASSLSPAAKSTLVYL